MVYTAEIAREYWNLGPRIIITIQTQGGIMKIIWNQIKLVCLLTNWFVIYPNFTYYSELLFIFANSKSLFLPPKTPFFFFFEVHGIKTISPAASAFYSHLPTSPSIHSSVCLTIFFLPLFFGHHSWWFHYSQKGSINNTLAYCLLELLFSSTHLSHTIPESH